MIKTIRYEMTLKVNQLPGKNPTQTSLLTIREEDVVKYRYNHTLGKNFINNLA